MFFLVLLLLLGWHANSLAADAVAPSAVPGITASGVPAISAIAKPDTGTPAPTDNGSWKGDKIKLANDVINVSGPNGSSYFAPDGSIFIVTDDDEKTHKLIVKFINTEPSSDGRTVKLINSRHLFFYQPTDKGADRVVPSASTNGAVDTHQLYALDKSAVEKMYYYRHGWAFGVLTVPYKYQLHDKSFGSALSIGPYLGYRTEDRGSSITWVISAGYVNNIPVPLANNTGTVNRSGFSIAVGPIISINKGTGMEIGVLAGQDRLGSNAAAPYQYEGKTWVSIAIGFKFF